MRAILITSSILILVLIVLRYLLRGRISPQLQYALWLLVALRLLTPISLPGTALSVLNFLPPEGTERTVSQQRAPASVSAFESGTMDDTFFQGDQASLSEEATPTVPPKGAFDLGGVLRLTWALGAAAMAVWFFTVNLCFFVRARKDARRLEAEESPVPVYVSASVPSPCLLGLVNQRIYVTPVCLEDPARLRHVLSHELTHRCQGDPWWSLVRAVCLCIYWFNPLVWWAAALSRRDCELACDAQTLRYLGEAERIAYGRTLVGLVAAGVSPGSLLQTATAMYSGKSGLKERVALIAEKPRMLAVTALCLLAVVGATAACTFTDAEPEQADTVEISKQENSQEPADRAAQEGRDEKNADASADGKEPFLPSEDEVLEARRLALEGMSGQEIEKLTSTIKHVNIYLEQQYMEYNLFEQLSDPEGLYWNYFHQTGEIQIGWAYDGDIDMEAVCQQEHLSEEEFYAQYGTPVMATNYYDADAFVSLVEELKEPVQNEALSADLQDIIDLTELAKQSHVMEYVNCMYKKIHDLDYFLLRYGPTDVGPYVRDDSTISKYYGTLSIFQ